MKNKKLISFFFIASFAAVSIWYNLQSADKKLEKNVSNEKSDPSRALVLSKTSQVNVDTKTSSVTSSVNQKKNHHNNGRTISSTKNVPKDLIITNQFNPEWKSQYLKNIERSFFDEKVKVDIEHLRSLVYVKYNKGRLAEKVKVSITRENGRYSSYTALVDAQTGSLINSWNPMRYEFKDKITLEGRGAEFAQ